MSCERKGSKQFKVSLHRCSKALAAQADEAIKERIRTAPPSAMYTSLCPFQNHAGRRSGGYGIMKTILQATGGHSGANVIQHNNKGRIHGTGNAGRVHIWLKRRGIIYLLFYIFYILRMLPLL